MSEQTNSKRIAKNTLMLYFRQILIMLVSLYTVRVVLNVLGAEDYGIYNVVAGVVTMFGFLSGAMATASQRYFSYALGKNDNELLKRTFGITISVYLLFVSIFILLAESIGMWFVIKKLVIPAERLNASIIVYQFAILSFVVTILTTPYMASIIAHEKMNIYAYVSIMEVILKLLIVFVLRWGNLDKLSLYSILLFCVTVINTFVYRRVCIKKFEECKSKPVWDLTGIKDISSFIGWNFFGSLATIAKNQGHNVFLNLYFGPVVNAAQGVATQVRSAVLNFSQNFSLAVRPQIIKSYAANEYEKLQSILIFSCKITFFLMLIIVVPVFGCLDYILKLWLKNIPEYTVEFVKFLLIESLIDSISLPMSSANQATGKIGLYQFMIGCILVLNLPFTYFVLKLGYPPYTIYVGSIIFITCVSFVRLFFLKQIKMFSIKKFLYKLYFPMFLITIISFGICRFINLENQKLLIVILEILVKIIVIAITIIMIGLEKNERQQIISIVIDKLRRK